MNHLVEKIKRRLRLRDVIERDIGPAIEAGERCKWKCPFHDDHEPSLFLTPDGEGFRCFGCNVKGDVFTWVMKRNNWDFSRAKQELAHLAGVSATDDAKRSLEARSATSYSLHSPRPTKPPNSQWQETAWQFLVWAQEQLFSPVGARTLDYLRDERGLDDDMIRRAGLGYNPKAWQRDAMRWGFSSGEFYLWRGLTIPYVVGDNLWAIEIRDEDLEPGGGKYKAVKGSKRVLYNADLLRIDKPAVLVEGVMDALTLEQVADDLITACATGGANNAQKMRWAVRLALCPTVLVTFDEDDEAGMRARRIWKEALSHNASVWLPRSHDVNAMHQDGLDVRAWVLSGLRQSVR